MKNLFRCRNLHFRKQFISLNCTELTLATPLPGCYQQPCTKQPQSGSSPPDVRELLYNILASEWDLVCCAKLQRQSKSSIAQTKQRDKHDGQILAANYAYEHSLGASNINRACRKSIVGMLLYLHYTPSHTEIPNEQTNFFKNCFFFHTH